MPVERISIFCFGASYAAALAFELSRLIRPGRTSQTLALVLAGAGLVAHSVFLALRLPSLATDQGSLLLLSWIMAVFYFLGSLRHSGNVWGVFPLLVVLGLVCLGAILPGNDQRINLYASYLAVDGREFWRILHVTLFVLAGTGICVGFVAGVMYLIQAHRLRAKALPGRGLRLLSLERLEAMNRRAIGLAFPFLTAGLLVGTSRLLDRQAHFSGWWDIRILGTLALWVVFAMLLWLRYGFRLQGRRAAVITIAAFVLLLVTLVSAHGPTAGGAP